MTKYNKVVLEYEFNLRTGSQRKFRYKNRNVPMKGGEEVGNEKEALHRAVV